MGGRDLRHGGSPPPDCVSARKQYICANLRESAMPAQSARYGLPDPAEPVIHELPPIRFGGLDVAVRVEVRRSPDGVWRGRFLFGGDALAAGHATAEIFCGPTEADLWEAVRDLREHHIRDLYRSIAE